MDLLWERADEGNVAATKALYDHYRRLQGPARDEDPPVGDRESVEAAIYGDSDSNVTPLRPKRKS